MAPALTTGTTPRSWWAAGAVSMSIDVVSGPTNEGTRMCVHLGLHAVAGGSKIKESSVTQVASTS
jgi:hypothetical protein